MNWGQAQLDNALNYFLNPKAPHETGADLDAKDPVMKVLPSAQDVDKRVFQGISALAGRDVQPYEPESFFGKLGQAAITGGLGGFLDPLAAAGAVGRGATVGKALLEGGARRAGQTALAADAANATQQAFPDSPGLAAAAAVAAHGGSSAVGAVARGGGGAVADAARQVVRPGVQGEREAGQVLQRVDNTQPGLARPGDAEMDSAGQSVRAATDAVGAGLPDHMAGANLRSGLQARVDALKGERAAQADKAFEGMVFEYADAALRGTARRNLKMLAEIMAGAIVTPPIYADEFLRWSNVLADITREELLVLAAFYRNSQKGAVVQQAVGGALEATELEMVAVGVCSSKQDFISVLSALGRTGLVMASGTYGGLGYATTPKLGKLMQLIKIEGILCEPDR